MLFLLWIYYIYNILFFWWFSELSPVRNRLINIIPIQERTWELSFDMILLESTSERMTVLHFTTGDNSAHYGDRTPAIFTLNNTLLMRSNIHSSEKYFSKDHIIPLNQKISVKIQQVYHMFSTTQTDVRIFIDRNQIYEITHQWKIPFENVKCYFGNPWYNPAPVRISNLRYTQKMLYPGKIIF